MNQSAKTRFWIGLEFVKWLDVKLQPVKYKSAKQTNFIRQVVFYGFQTCSLFQLQILL